MMNKNKMILIGGGFLIAFVFMLVLANWAVPKILVTSSKAAVSSKISIKNSLIIGEKIVAEADGVDKCKVYVFAIDNDGKGVVGKQVQLSGLGVLTGMTDNLGKASFELKSTEAKQYELTATVNGSPIGKTLKVTFR